MKRLKIVYGRGSARSRRRSLRRSPDPLVGWGGMSPSPYSSPIDAFDCNSWMFVGTTRKDGHWTTPIFETWLRLWFHVCCQD